jgi:lipoprotein signal peptidase
LVHYENHIFPAFNVADSSLFCGAATWMVLMLIEWRQGRGPNADDVEDASV